MSNPITSRSEFLKELASASEALADSNGLHGHHSILRVSDGKPLELEVHI